jgi:hypothetical protein
MELETQRTTPETGDANESDSWRDRLRRVVPTAEAYHEDLIPASYHFTQIIQAHVTTAILSLKDDNTERFYDAMEKKENICAIQDIGDMDWFTYHQKIKQFGEDAAVDRTMGRTLSTKLLGKIGTITVYKENESVRPLSRTIGRENVIEDKKRFTRAKKFLENYEILMTLYVVSATTPGKYHMRNIYFNERHFPSSRKVRASISDHELFLACSTCHKLATTLQKKNNMIICNACNSMAVCSIECYEKGMTNHSCRPQDRKNVGDEVVKARDELRAKEKKQREKLKKERNKKNRKNRNMTKLLTNYEEASAPKCDEARNERWSDRQRAGDQDYESEEDSDNECTTRAMAREVLRKMKGADFDIAAVRKALAEIV